MRRATAPGRPSYLPRPHGPIVTGALILSLGEELRRNTLWVLAGDAGARLATLAFGIVLARLLTPEDFGLVVTVQILTGALAFVAAHGTGDALVRARSMSDRDVGTVFAIQIVTCLALMGLLFLIAAPFAAWFRDARLESLLRLAAVTFLLRPFISIPDALLRRAMRFREISLLIFTGIVAAGLASTGFAIAGMGAWGLVLGGLVGTLVRVLLAMRLARWVPRLAFDPCAARVLGLFGLKLSANEILHYLRGQTANAVVSRQLGVAPVGLYNKADSLAEIPYVMVSGSAQETLFRTLAGVRDDLERCAHLFLRSITLVSFYTLPFYVGLIWVAEPFIVLLYGEHWAGAALPLQILALAGLFRVVANLARAVAASHNLLGREITIQLQTWVILIVGILAGLNWGLPGVALGVIPSFVFHAVRMYRLAGVALGVGLSDLAAALRPVVALNTILALSLAAADGLLSAAGLDDARILYLLVMVPFGAGVYAGLFLWRPATALRTESERWRQQLRALWGRLRRRDTPTL